MKEFWKSTGPAGFGSHTEIQPTLELLVQKDGGYSIYYGCSKVVEIGNTIIETYYTPHEVQLLLESKSKAKIRS